ncbi:MAG: hypothetical protein D8B38_01900 [Candidatus Saccharimonas sp.]|nr:MAG: hypothetical protein D8B38_01900 [Candidatus Saccharimonas sp.]
MKCLLLRLELLIDGSYKFCKTRMNATYRAMHIGLFMCCEAAKYTMWHTQILRLGLQKCDAVKINFLFRRVGSLCEASAAVAACFSVRGACVAR